MVLLNELVNHTNQYLNIDDYQDYSPNGLQVEGKSEVKKIITGVTACQALLEEAVKQNADAVLVHHGYFWKSEDPRVIGMKKNRLTTLIKNDISLLGYHLPLDGHSTLGNNVELAKVLGLELSGEFETGYGPGVGRVGVISGNVDGQAFAGQIAKQLNRQPLYIPGQSSDITKIGWCSGGAQSSIVAAHLAGCDAYLTGEASEQTTHQARELGMHFYAAGHHATERYGVMALGEHLADQFDVEVQFVDIDNPV